MPSDDRPEIKKAIANEIRAHGEPKPPWELFPDVPPRVEEWREGERHRRVLIWGHWWIEQARTWSDTDRSRYLDRHQMPREWKDCRPIFVAASYQTENWSDPERLFASALQRIVELRLSMDKRIAKEVRAYGEVRPPWEYAAGDSPYSMRWRMGDGEDHRELFDEWWSRNQWSEAQRIEYFRRHRPPVDWLTWAASAIWDEFKTRTNREQAVQRLEQLGLGSYEEWVRRQMQPPWERER